ncbi:CocE/NonD family hydrolase [Chelativorans xinjiangense]|uniref:CocE/NonD family hydrolase n=1 Tax=Chelativorans xinjiangense TaxID=2681485 RepID=UPI0013598E5E|nr:CocE/NonD family hydrolase [Chelativorans xinjiangense]
MKTRTEFPHRAREVEHAWVPLSDGTKLSARYWLPEDAAENPVPAILEYYPYRKRDHTRVRDETMHPYFAGHGYCAFRVDLRGSGESDGILHDEYLAQEQDDALEVIAWIAAQPWCSGKVGMIGKSWAGFNTLQIAARAPQALACIVTVYSTDDRYADDVHYMGGCLLTHNVDWGFRMFCRNGQPPDPDLVGPRWKEMWLARLEENRPWLTRWLEHPRRDAYWKHGSVCEDFAAIKCPVYAVGGWGDGYSNAVPRLLAGLQVPCKGLIGPWGHQYAHRASPGPRIGFLQECLRWWDHWLKGIDTGIMEEPAYRVWMQDTVEPSSVQEELPGRWVAEDRWPSPRIETREFAINPDGPGDTAKAEAAFTLEPCQTVGQASPFWMNKGTSDGAPEDPEDQRVDDARSFSFDTPPLKEDLEILGAPVVVLEVSVDRPVAFVCVRLCDVAPGGASTRISYGLLNLTHDATHERVEPVTPGERKRIQVRLNDAAYRFPAGHRIRVACSTSFWPLVWPSPSPVTLTVHTGASQLRLPVRPPRSEDADLRSFAPAEQSPALPTTELRPPAGRTATVLRDLGQGRITVHDVRDTGRVRIDASGWEYSSIVETERSIVEGDPLSARVWMRCELAFGRHGDLDLCIEGSTAMTSTEDHFHLETRMSAYENGRPVFARSWLDKIPRDGI